MKTCENNVKVGNHIIFILFSHVGAWDPGLGPKAAAGRARAGPPAAALGPGPWSRAQESKKNEKDTLKYNKKYYKLN